MADFDANIIIKLGVKKAKSSLRGLRRSAQQSRRRRNTQSTTRKTIGGRLGTFVGGLAGYGAVSRITRTSGDNVDPWAEALTPFKAAFQQFVDATLGYSTLARKRALAGAVGRFAPSVIAASSMDVAVRHYNETLGFMSEEEEGRNILRQDPNFKTPSIAELLAAAVPGYFVLFWKSLGYVKDAFTGEGGGHGSR